MVGLPYDCLANPLGAVRFTFEKAVSSGSDPASLQGEDWGAADLFRHVLSDEAVLSKVPILNGSTIQSLQPNTLLRFRGMIQDMLGNEFYVGAYKDGSVWRTNKYTDNSQSPMGSSQDVHLWDRRLLYCVPVPGRNSWTGPPSEIAMSQFVDFSAQHGEKRRRTDDEALDKMDSSISDSESRGSPIKKMKQDGYPSSSSLPPNSILEGASAGTALVTGSVGDSLSCLVKIYDSLESELKLNDVVEFVGVIAFNSKVTVNDHGDNEFTDNLFEDDLLQSPLAEVPCLHCLIYKRLSVQDFLLASPILEPKPQIIREIRESLVKHLTAVLGNDELAANFVLLHLLSKVHSRVDDIAVGRLSLNLTRLNKESVAVFGSRLSQALNSLLPFTQYIPLTIEYLNTASLGPKKDYQVNRLTPGGLQLAEGSHMMFDETQLEAGTLNSVGVENARLLKHLTEFQKVEYDFKYYKLEMATDVQLLILSEGKSNIMPADLIVPVQPSEANFINTISPESLDAWRWYLATTRSLPHEIEPEVQKLLETDLVAARQADRSLGSQDFSRLLTMARLMSASFGATRLSVEQWQMVMELERLRRERLGSTNVFSS